VRGFPPSAALCIATLLASAPLSAKTLVYCAEGSPENLYPAINTTGTSFDANSQIYEPHRRFRAWRHQGGVGPGGAVGHIG
jgi:ABC-type transport system substrate-binding protein